MHSEFFYLHQKSYSYQFQVEFIWQTIAVLVTIELINSKTIDLNGVLSFAT